MKRTIIGTVSSLSSNALDQVSLSCERFTSTRRVDSWHLRTAGTSGLFPGGYATRILTLGDGILIVGLADQNVGCERACQQALDDFVFTWIESFVRRHIIVRTLVIPPSEEIRLKEPQAALYTCERWSVDVRASLWEKGESSKVTR